LALHKSRFTGESNEEIITVLRTSSPREPVFENSTIKIFMNSLRDDLTQETKMFFIFIRIDVLIFMEMVINDFIESGFFRSSSFIHFAVHNSITRISKIIFEAPSNPF